MYIKGKFEFDQNAGSWAERDRRSGILAGSGVSARVICRRGARGASSARGSLLLAWVMFAARATKIWQARGHSNNRTQHTYQIHDLPTHNPQQHGHHWKSESSILGPNFRKFNIFALSITITQRREVLWYKVLFLAKRQINIK